MSKLSKYKHLLKNTGYLTAIEVLRLLMPFLALPYIIRTIGAYNYGLVVFAQTLISYFLVVINFGLDISAVKDVSVNRDNKTILNKIIISVLFIKTILLLLSGIIMVLAVFLFPALYANRLLYFFAFLTCFAEILFPVWYYQGIEKMQYLTMIRSISILFYVSSIFIFVRNQDDYLMVPLLQSLGNIIAGVVSFALLLRRESLSFRVLDLSFVKSTFKDSIPFFVSRLSSVLNNSMAKTISGIVFSMNIVAAFDLAQKITSFSLVPMQMLNQAIYPHLAKTRDKIFAQKFLYVNVFLSFSIAAIVFLFAPLMVQFFSGNELPEAIMLVRILSVWLFLGGIVTYLGTPVLVAFGHPKPFNQSIIFSSILLLCLYALLFLFKVDNIILFAVVLVIMEFYIFSHRMLYCFRHNLLSVMKVKRK